MNICFVANYRVTYLFHLLSKELEQENINIFWITVNEGIHRFLAQQYGEKNVLLIDLKMLSSNNIEVGEYKLNELIYTDRALSHDKKSGKTFLRRIQQPIKDFLQNNKMAFVFGEITWAHELLVKRMCNDIDGCLYLNPHSIRIPKDRFAFFTDESQSKLYEFTNPSASKDRIIEYEVPSYVASHKQKEGDPASFRQKRDLIENELGIKQNTLYDPTTIKSSMSRKKKRWSEKFNRFYYHRLKKKTQEEVLQSPFIYIPLHKQPEASIDVIGRYYEDQKVNILNIWRVLPDNWKIVVKEHPTAIGDRGFSFYRDLLKYEDILIVDEKASSYTLTIESECVVTVSGTAAYEAGLIGKKAITLSPAFFNQLKGVVHITIDDLKQCQSFNELLAKNGTTASIEEFSKHVLERSCDGTISDPALDPYTISERNIQNLKSGFLNIIKNKEVNVQ